jgi:hypothetical protein
MGEANAGEDERLLATDDDADDDAAANAVRNEEEGGTNEDESDCWSISEGAGGDRLDASSSFIDRLCGET